MKMNLQIAFLALVIFVVLAVALAYTTFTTAVSLDHARAEQEHQRNQQHLLQALLLKTGNRLSQADYASLVRESFGKDHIVKEEAGQLTIDDIALTFSGGALVGVSSLGDGGKNP